MCAHTGVHASSPALERRSPPGGSVLFRDLWFVAAKTIHHGGVSPMTTVAISFVAVTVILRYGSTLASGLCGVTINFFLSHGGFRLRVARFSDHCRHPRGHRGGGSHVRVFRGWSGFRCGPARGTEALSPSLPPGTCLCSGPARMGGRRLSDIAITASQCLFRTISLIPFCGVRAVGHYHHTSGLVQPRQPHGLVFRTLSNFL
jgi:hypothetical protein